MPIVWLLLAAFAEVKMDLVELLSPLEMRSGDGRCGRVSSLKHDSVSLRWAVLPAFPKPTALSHCSETACFQLLADHRATAAWPPFLLRQGKESGDSKHI